MSDLISRERAKEIICNGWSNHWNCKDMCGAIDEQPIVDTSDIEIQARNDVYNQGVIDGIKKFADRLKDVVIEDWGTNELYLGSAKVCVVINRLLKEMGCE